MSYQRRRGKIVTVWLTGTGKDRLGNTTKAANPEVTRQVRAHFTPDRSSKAEVPGQQQINVYEMRIAPQTPDVDLWSRVEWRDRLWDVVTPPAERRGGPHATRHWTLSIRERPTPRAVSP